LDKKLIVRVENIDYTYVESKTQTSFQDIKKSIENLPIFLKYFQEIDIKNLNINNNSFEILLKKNRLQIDNKFINIFSKINFSTNRIDLDIESLYLKDYEILFRGKANLDYFKEELKYYGDIFYQDLIIKSHLDFSKQNKFKFFISSEKFKNIHFLKELLPDLPEVAKEWMYDNVTGDFKLDWFYGEFDFKNKEIIESSLKGEASINNAQIMFHPNVDKVLANSVKVKFKNNNLNFDLINATYKDKVLSNSFVTLKDLTDEDKGRVYVNLETISALDKDILDILQAYDITVPVLQTKGNTNAKLLLEFPYDSKLDIVTNGEFIVDKSDIKIADFEFNTNGGKVTLNNNLLKLEQTSFILKNMVDAQTDLTLDLNTLKAKGKTHINRVFIEDNKKSSILDLKDKNSEISMDFSKNFTLELINLATKINYIDYLNIELKDLSLISSFSKILKDNQIKKGEANIDVLNEDNIDFKATVFDLPLPLKKNGEKITKLEVNGEIRKEAITITSLDESLQLIIKNNIDVHLANYEIDFSNEKENTFTSVQDINIYLSNCNLIVENYNFNIVDAKASMQKESINFDAFVKDLNFPISKNNQIVKSLEISGVYKNSKDIKIKTKSKDLLFFIKNDTYNLRLKGYDLDIELDNKDKEAFNNNLKLDIKGTNSNIIINKDYKLLADTYDIVLSDEKSFLFFEHKDSKISIKLLNKNDIEVYASNINDIFINTLLNKSVMDKGTLNIFVNGTLPKLDGKIVIKDSNLKNISILNNVLFFLETTPAIINPFLAIPSLFGLDKLGTYKVLDGTIEFIYDYDSNIIDIKNLYTKGNGIDFDGQGTINLAKNKVNFETKLIFLKTYSSIVEYIPILNYILLGDNNRVETRVSVKGDLDNPKISTHLVKDGAMAPLNMLKRVITTPANIIDGLNKLNDKTDQKEEDTKEENE